MIREFSAEADETRQALISASLISLACYIPASYSDDNPRVSSVITSATPLGYKWVIVPKQRSRVLILVIT